MAVDDEYMFGTPVSQERNVSRAFVPVNEKLLLLGGTNPVADAGFKSEVNYAWCEEDGQMALIKLVVTMEQWQEERKQYARF
ncbi:MAG: hypothetical protein GX060_00370 [Firmicutes bacterium]|nr:hypothetical protein [Bacillota bacterium]